MLKLHEADQCPRELWLWLLWRWLPVFHQILQVVNHWPQAVLDVSDVVEGDPYLFMLLAVQQCAEGGLIHTVETVCEKDSHLASVILFSACCFRQEDAIYKLIQEDCMVQYDTTDVRLYMIYKMIQNNTICQYSHRELRGRNWSDGPGSCESAKSGLGIPMNHGSKMVQKFSLKSLKSSHVITRLICHARSTLVREI